MSRFSRPQPRDPMMARGQNKGAMRALRTRKRGDAINRNGESPAEKRAWFREQARRGRKPNAGAA